MDRNNYNIYENFFGDDDEHQISKKELAKQEYDYIKSKDSWGSDYTISFACILFNIEIVVYIFDGKDSYKHYHYFYFDNNKNNNDDKELLLLSFHNITILTYYTVYMKKILTLLYMNPLKC